MFSTLYGTYFPFQMPCKMSSALRFNLDQSKILLSGNGLRYLDFFSSSSSDGLKNFTMCQWRYLMPWGKILMKTVGKGKNSCSQHFVLFPECFIPYLTITIPFDPHGNCSLHTLSIWAKLDILMGESNTVLSAYTLYIATYNSIALTHGFVVWQKII